MNYFFGLEYNKENNRIMSFLWFIIIGIVAGYVAGKIIGSLVVATIGAIVLLWIVSLFSGRRHSE